MLLYSVQTTAAVAAGYGTDLSSDRSFTYIITTIIFKKQNAITTTPVARTVKYMFYGIIFNSPVLFFKHFSRDTIIHIITDDVTYTYIHVYIVVSTRVNLLCDQKKLEYIYETLIF